MDDIVWQWAGLNGSLAPLKSSHKRITWRSTKISLGAMTQTQQEVGHFECSAHSFAIYR